VSEWRWIYGDVEPVVSDGASNMALDHMMFEDVKAGGPSAFRLYRWSPACLSFGRNQPARGLYDEAAAAEQGIDFVRRPTGGQAVLHDRELTYCVALPLGVLGSPRETYMAIHEAIVLGLASIGVLAATRQHTSPGPRTQEAWLLPCFAGSARGEVVLEGKKLVGSAQRCEDRCVLQHGSILLDGDQSFATTLLKEGEAARDASPVATLAPPAMKGVGVAALAAALGHAFAAGLGTALAPDTLSGNELGRVQELAVHYRSAAWTWRR
jgi:lipoyl(octanoyl) transferase